MGSCVDGDCGFCLFSEHTVELLVGTCFSRAAEVGAFRHVATGLEADSVSRISGTTWLIISMRRRPIASARHPELDDATARRLAVDYFEGKLRRSVCRWRDSGRY